MGDLATGVDIETAPVSVSVVQLNVRSSSSVRSLLNRLKHVLLRDHSATRHCCISETLSAGDHIGSDIKLLCSKRCTESTKASDHFIEDQKNVVFGADLSDTFKIANRRRENTSTASNRLDNLNGHRNRTAYI